MISWLMRLRGISHDVTHTAATTLRPYPVAGKTDTQCWVFRDREPKESPSREHPFETFCSEMAGQDVKKQVSAHGATPWVYRPKSFIAGQRPASFTDRRS